MKESPHWLPQGVGRPYIISHPCYPPAHNTIGERKFPTSKADGLLEEERGMHGQSVTSIQHTVSQCQFPRLAGILLQNVRSKKKLGVLGLFHSTKKTQVGVGLMAGKPTTSL